MKVMRVVALVLGPLLLLAIGYGIVAWGRLGAENTALRTELSEAQQQLAASKSEHRRVEQLITDHRREMGSQRGIFEARIARLTKENGTLQTSFSDLRKSTGVLVGEYEAERAEIAGEIAQEIQDEFELARQFESRPVVDRPLRDYNRDGLIDSADKDAILRARGKRIGNPGFLPGADLDGDGQISTRDAEIFDDIRGNEVSVVERRPLEDLNQDGSIDAVDGQAIVAAAAQVKMVGDEGYIEAADQDGDGIISLRDAAIFMQRLNE